MTYLLSFLVAVNKWFEMLGFASYENKRSLSGKPTVRLVNKHTI